MEKTNVTPVLRIENLCKSLGGRQILKDISFCIGTGEIFGFLGPNGSGKTTTIKLMLGLLRIDAGRIFISGHNIETDFEAAIANVGGIIENPEMYSYLTGRQNLEQYARMYERIPKERIDEVVKLVNLEDRIDDKISKYSLGMRQRLGVAQALINRPRLLVLDEPTNGLDPAGIRDLRDILKQLSHEEGVSVFVSSHLLAELELMCDRVGVIDRGMLLDIKTMEDLRHTGGAGHTTVEIVVLNPAVATKVLEQAGIEYKSVGSKLTLSVSDEVLPDLVKRLALSDTGVIAVIPLKRTLEDAFLEMTRPGFSPGEEAQK